MVPWGPAGSVHLAVLSKTQHNINSRPEVVASSLASRLRVPADSKRGSVLLFKVAASIIPVMTHTFRFNIEESDAGQRLDEFFASRFGALSRMRIANLIEAGSCLVNGAVARAGYRIVPGDSLDISFDDGAPTAMSPEPIPLEVVHEDEHLIVVVKPAGMLVHPTMSVKTGTLANALAYYLNREACEGQGFRVPHRRLEPEHRSNANAETWNPEPLHFRGDGERHSLTRPGLVHRLDRATSGLMVVARTPRALTILSRHFRKRLVQKKYLALVSGIVRGETGTINAPIDRDSNRQPRWRVMEGGKVAETRFKILEKLDQATLLELEPVTGRTNQLRIHCAHIGHPIIGDATYRDYSTRMSDLKFKDEAQAGSQQSEVRNLQIEERLCLHACGLAFHHPAGGAWMEFVSPAPDPMQAIIRQHQKS